MGDKILWPKITPTTYENPAGLKEVNCCANCDFSYPCDVKEDLKIDCGLGGRKFYKRDVFQVCNWWQVEGWNDEKIEEAEEEYLESQDE